MVAYNGGLRCGGLHAATTGVGYSDLSTLVVACVARARLVKCLQPTCATSTNKWVVPTARSFPIFFQFLIFFKNYKDRNIYLILILFVCYSRWARIQRSSTQTHNANHSQHFKTLKFTLHNTKLVGLLTIARPILISCKIPSLTKSS